VAANDEVKMWESMLAKGKKIEGKKEIDGRTQLEKGVRRRNLGHN
jgi:hypothetical protein